MEQQVMSCKVITGLALAGALVLGALGQVTSAGAQSGGFCSKFDSGLDSWGPCPTAPNIIVSTSTSGGISPGDPYLQLTDLSNASAACSTDPKYQGSWVEKVGGCGQFCFDFKVFHAGSPPAPITPQINIFDSTMTVRATFVANFSVTAADPWRQRICAPIRLIQPGESLPSSASGGWSMSGSTAHNSNWNGLITNVGIVMLPIDVTDQPSEIIGYDNLCTEPGICPPPPPEVTGCLKDMKAEVKCNPDGSYSLTLSGSSFIGNDISLTSQTPGVTVVPSQQPWSATTTWTLVGATPGQTVTLTANSTQVGGGAVAGTDLCCAGEIKITLPECPKPPPPIDVKIGKENTPAGGQGNQFNIWVTNVGAPITFPAGAVGLTVTDAIPAGMTVLSVTAPNWTCGPPPPPALVGANTLTCTYNLAGSLATGAQLTDSIVVNAVITGGESTVTNCATVSIGAAVGVDTNPANDTACVPVTKPGQPVDVAITKTGGTSPVQLPHYSFTLTVSNIGAAFPGSNNITVTDVLPPLISFTTVSAAPPADWSCPSSVAAGGTLTCTYIGSGPTGSGVIGTIAITALAGGAAPYPPITNCATVGTTATSGYSDTDPTNNNLCVTLTKRTMGCPAPMVAGPIPGVCACPPGTMQAGKECVRLPLACAPPLVLGPVPGSCVCPQGTVQQGRECVRPRVCAPPMIAGPIPGSCVCPQGAVQRGRRCVPPIACRPPQIANAAATACVCPAGLVQRGRSCVQPTVCNPPAKLNRRGACECPRDMVARGNTCIARERR